MTFSVIIPALNEDKHIRSCVRSVRAADGNVEIIVVDGGSADGTSEIALQEGAIVVGSARGRGTQMNRGVERASGEIFVFLHADSLVAPDLFDVLREQFVVPQVKIGTCRLQFDVKHPLLQLYASCARIESVFTTFGDQCIAVRRSFFDTIGGFPTWQLFEDVDLLQRARRETRIFSFPTTVVTSARKFIENGIVRQQLRNARFLSLYLMGINPNRLSTMYNRRIRRNITPASKGHDIFHQPTKRRKQCEHSMV
jgi:rSAM/selenodomain-associated transferase 2